MKHTMRLVLLLAIVAALLFGTALSPSLTARAQATDNCFGLSADDCALLNASHAKEALAKLTSFNVPYVLTLSGGGMRGNGGNLSIKGNGPFQFDTYMANAIASWDP